MDVLCEACESLKWKAPTKIQKEAIPVALKGTFCETILQYYLLENKYLNYLTLCCNDTFSVSLLA